MAKTTQSAKLALRPGENGFKYQPKFGLVVPCANEAEQQRLYAKLTKQGLAPKVVCV